MFMKKLAAICLLVLITVVAGFGQRFAVSLLATLKIGRHIFQYTEYRKRQR